MNKISNLLWGVVFVVVGVIFGLNAFDITEIDLFFDGWWTLFIIVPCFIGFFKEEDKTGNLIGFMIGLCLLLGCQDIIEFAVVWKLMLPTILVMIGLSFILKDVLNDKVKKEIKKLNKNEMKEYSACFSGQTLDFSGEEFKGCSMSAVFGGIKCDLREAIIKEDIVVNASSVFGGITIYVPEDINVKTNSTSVFGGVSDERKNKKRDGKHTIYIQVSSMFGGVEIK